jgi:hypothetical protein
MITVKTNISVVGTRLLNKLSVLRDPRPLLRSVAIDVLPLITARIHEDGQAADGTQIGTYSSEYMKVRTGNYGNSGKVSRGKRKGALKDAGVYSRGKHKESRPQYHRSSDRKIIVSLTRQLENDWSVIATPSGWGIGFKNPLNAQKMKWVEQRKGKKIAALTSGEKDYALNRLKALVHKEISQ